MLELSSPQPLQAESPTLNPPNIQHSARITRPLYTKAPCDDNFFTRNLLKNRVASAPMRLTSSLYLAFFLALPVLCALACGDTTPAASSSNQSGSSSSSGGGNGGNAGQSVPACDAHQSPGAATFSDRSTDWGLAGVNGTILTAGDLNGDGYPELIAHLNVVGQRELEGQAGHHYQVLWNEPHPSGKGRTFADRTVESGYGNTYDQAPGELRAAQMALFGDLDNDGDTDIFSGTYNDPNAMVPDPDRSVVLLNDGTGHFALGPECKLQTPGPSPLSSASLLDTDRDGVLDLFLGHWYGASGLPSYQRLLQGTRETPGYYWDISNTSGIKVIDNARPAFGVTACDLNDDGQPEILVSSYGRAPNMLFQSDGPNHFKDIALEAGYAYDENQSYTDNQFFLCACQLSPAEPSCAGAPAPAVQCPTPAELPAYWDFMRDTVPERLGGNTFTTVCSDITGDGAFDLYNAEIVHWWAGQGSDPSELLVNTSDASGIRFTRPGNDKTGLAWPHPTSDWNEGGLYAAAADIDNDARQDLIVGASDYDDQYGMYFHQKGDGTFEEIAQAAGFHHACAHNPLVVDFDRDGDLDIVVGSSRMRQWCSDAWPTNEVHFYENKISDLGGKSIAIRLKGNGTSANTSGIGARVVVRTIDQNGTETLQTKEMSGGFGHSAIMHDTVLHFGLGNCEAIHSIEVAWPDAQRSKDRYENVPVHRLIELRQGDPAAAFIVE